MAIVFYFLIFIHVICAGLVGFAFAQTKKKDIGERVIAIAVMIIICTDTAIIWQFMRLVGIR